jgi:hypothetical protein
MPLNTEDLFGIGLTRGKKIQRSFLGGIRFGSLSVVQDIALVGFQASKAGTGGFVPSVIGQSFASAAGVPIAGVASAAVCLIPGIGPGIAAVIGTLVGGYSDVVLGGYLSNKVRWFTDLNRRIRHIEMGGNYQDTLTAKKQRLRAIQDMNAALIPGRRFLGQEALLMHR